MSTTVTTPWWSTVCGSCRIQYLFIPEGNKTHAMYWATEYWIPELVRRQESVDFGFAMIIDDDVPLPPDLHVPLHTLSRQDEIKVCGDIVAVFSSHRERADVVFSTSRGRRHCVTRVVRHDFFCQAVSYVICAATEKGHYNSLVALQDAEYMMAVRALWLGAALPLCRCCVLCPVLPGLVVDRGTVGVAFAGLHEAAAVALWLHDVVPRCNWIVASRRAWQEGSRRLCAVQSVALARVRGCSFAVFADLT